MAHLELPADDSCHVRVWASSFDHPKSSHGRVMDAHEFNYSVEVVVTNVAWLPDLVRLLEAECYWKGEEDLSTLASHGERFSDLVVLSQGFRGTVDDCVARCGDGRLVVQLSDASHLRCGLSGTRHDQVWRSVLTSPLSQEAASRLPKRMPLMACLRKNNNNNSAASQQQPPPPSWERCMLRLQSHRLESLRLPVLHWSLRPDPEDCRGALQWLGTVVAGISPQVIQGQEFVSDWRTESDVGENGVVGGLVRWSGMLRCEAIQKIVEELREKCAKDQSNWACVMVRGFDDHPVGEGGEDNYAFIIHPGGKHYWGYIMSKTFPL